MNSWVGVKIYKMADCSGGAKDDSQRAMAPLENIWPVRWPTLKF